MIVTQEHGVQPTQGIGDHGWSLRLAQHVRSGTVLAAGGVECRICQKADSPEFQQRGGPSDIRHLQFATLHLPPF